MLKSLESGDASRLFDSVANPILALHLQARHSLDESSADLTSGFHNSWRLSQWSKRIHGASLFTIDEEEGTIEIPTDGLYLVYAQVCLQNDNERTRFTSGLTFQNIVIWCF